uniref:50S ribosomal protein L2 n=1 Tax=Anthurium amnicola TaxID=1678845 RepID=A0A1D1XDX4_9ARAE
MNTLGKGLPNSGFQQKVQQQSVTTNGSMSKCSPVSYAVGDISGSNSSRKAKNKMAMEGTPTDSTLHSGSCQISSNGSNQVSIVPDGDASVMSISNGLISDMWKGEGHVKGTAIKEKRRRRKLRKNPSADVLSVAAAETADQTCPTTESTNVTNKPLPLESMVGAGNSSNYGITPDCSWIVQTTLVSEPIKPSIVSADSQCTVLRSKESVETLVSKESLVDSLKIGFSSNTSHSEKVEECRSTRSPTKLVKTFPASTVTSKDCESQPGNGSSKCARDCGDKLSNSASSLAQSCSSMGYRTTSNNGNQKMDICRSGSKQNTCEASRLDVNEGKVIFDCHVCRSEELAETVHFGSLSESILASVNSKTCSPSNISICRGESKTDWACSTVGTKFSRSSCDISKVDVIKANKSTEQDHRHHVNGMLHVHGHQHNLKQSGKENSKFTWKWVQKIGHMRTRRKEFMNDHRCRFYGFHEAALLSESNISSRPTCFAENFEGFASSVYLKDRNHGHVLEESFRWVPRQWFIDKIGQKALAQHHPAENKYGRPIEKLNRSYKLEKGMQCGKESLVGKSNPHRPPTKAAVFQTGILEVPIIKHKYASPYGREITHDNARKMHNCCEIYGLRILDSGSASKRPLSLWMPSKLLDSKVKTSACFKRNLPRDKTIKKDSTNIENPMKQIPMGCIDVTARNCMKDEANGESQSGSSCEASNPLGIRTDVECSDRLGTSGGICLVNKNINDTFDFQTKDGSVGICSQMTFQILNASYRSPTASECSKLSTGHPIAEFEKLLCAAAPIIFPSLALRCCDACTRNQCIPNVICRSHFSDVLLVNVWGWYEEHGNYGLEVKVEPSQNLKKVNADGDPFRAYFVPSLSAVQLFCHSQHPKHGSNPRTNIGMAKKSEDGTCSLPSALKNHFLPENFYPICSEVRETEVFSFPKSLEKPTRPSLLQSYDGSFLPLTHLLGLFDDLELLFEYFEHDRPEQRKPLCAKIKELVDIGTSNHHIYGDPSNLECMKLQDLHPASWYSVAWYPIYRIPEGTFRASFLTYHSLGHLVKRGIKADSTESALCIVSPVMGMESYNSQGECWFNLKKEVDIFPKNGTPFNSSEILEERLKTLEEMAAIFSRGTVYKSQVKVKNKHPDYEFFLSRK